jgi:1-acyl-sn-glycerol-3-phosphate acyltransferase
MATILSILIHPKTGSVMGVIWAKFNSYITPMFVKVYGRENIDRSRSYVVVANHQSQYDIFVIYGWYPTDFRWVMKIQLRSVPFLGYSCYKIGHVYIDRSNPEAAIASINQAKERIKAGTSIMFFPEGHRGEGKKMLPFKKGAFIFALDMGYPILPVTIVGTDKVLPTNTTALFPGKVKMIIHKPIEISGYSEKNMDELIQKSRDVVESGFSMKL